MAIDVNRTGMRHSQLVDLDGEIWVRFNLVLSGQMEIIRPVADV